MHRPLGSATAAGVVFVITLASVAAARDPIAPRLIGILNDRIQERFLDVDNGFGISRVMRPRPGPHRFEPENVREMAVVRDLERANVSAILYLGSAQRKIKGPVLVTGAGDGVANALTAPDAEGLREPLTKFIARPVRASSETCLRCHNVSLGEAVGVVMYGYRYAAMGR
jgi:hypothetical protein